jgi:hypothetical protein
MFETRRIEGHHRYFRAALFHFATLGAGTQPRAPR